MNIPSRMLPLLVAALAGPVLGAGSSLVLRVTPEEAVAGETTRVRLTVLAPGASLDDLRLLVEEGEVSDLQPDEEGYAAGWTLPGELKPRRLAAAVVDRRRDEVAFVTLSISRWARYYVEAPPGAKVEVKDRGALLAEDTADTQGRVALRILVPPGARVQARISHPQIDPRTERLVEHDSLRVWAVPTANYIKADTQTPTVVFALVYRDAPELGGKPQVSVHSDAATGQRAEQRSPAIHRSALVLKPQAAEDTVAIRTEARLKGERVTHRLVLPVGTAEGVAGGPRASDLQLAAHAGLLMDLEELVGPDFGLEMAYRLRPKPLPGLALLAAAGAGYLSDSREASTKGRGNGVSTERRLWRVPILLGARYEWEPFSAWRLSAGLGTGLLVGFVQQTKTKTSGKKVAQTDATDFAWEAGAWGSVGYRLGPGHVVLVVRGQATLTPIELWGRLYLGSVLAGYSLALF